MLIRWRTVRLLTRTVRHRSPMRLRHRCACNRLAAADLRRVTFAGSSLGRRHSFEVVRAVALMHAIVVDVLVLLRPRSIEGEIATLSAIFSPRQHGRGA